MTRTLAIAALGLCAACTAFESMERGVCGNFVTEAGEDCDGPADPSLAGDGETLACGAPDAEPAKACRYVCDDATCPTGSRCGTDGVCRAPSGRFERGALVELAADHLAIADMDGDGLADLAATAGDQIGVAFGDSDGRFSDRRSVATPGNFIFRGPPSFAPGRIATGIAKAPVVIDVTSERRFESVMSGSRVASNLSGDGEGVAFSVLLHQALFDPSIPFYDTSFPLVIDRSGTTLRVQQTLSNPGATTVALELANAPAGQIQQPALAELGPVIAGTTNEFTLAIAGDDVVRIGTVVFGEPTRPEIVSTVSLAGLGTVGGRPLFVDADGDGVLDLLVPITEAGGAARVAIAPGTGPDTFAAAAIDPRFDPFGAPLAAGDLDGDGDGDYVTAAGLILLSEPSALALSFRMTGAKTDVAIADLNRDGIPDLAAIDHRPGGAGSNNVEIAIGDGRGLFNPRLVEARGEVFELEAGDFDGDRVGDVAVLEHRAGGDALSVGFGAVDGAVTELVTIARKAHLAQLGAAFTFEPLDRINDLGMVAREEGSGALSTVVAIGGPGRLMVEGIALHSENALELYAAEQSLIADFGGDALSDLVTLTGTEPNGGPSCDSAIWLSPGRADGSYDLPIVEEAIVVKGRDRVRMRWIAGDIDGDQTSDVVGVAGVPGACDRNENRVVTLYGSARGAFSPYTPFDAPLAVDAFPGAADLADLDGDGFADLVVTTAAGVLAPLDGAIIFWNDPASNGRSFADLERFDFGGQTMVVAAQLDRDAGLELIAAVDSQLIVVDTAADRSVAAPEPRIATSIASPIAVAVGDLDGDGVDDVAVSDGAVVEVFYGVPLETLASELED